MTKKNLPPRNEVPIEETWNLESIFPNTKAWQEAVEEVEARLPELAAYQGRLGESAQILLEYLDKAQEVTRLAMKVMVYAGLELSTDVSVPEANARVGQSRGLMAKVAAVRAFEDPELMAMGFDKLRRWMEEEPELAIYEHYFDNLERMSAHVRSSEVEEILAMATEPMQPSTPYTSLVNFELKFKPAVAGNGTEMEVGQSSIGALKTDPDREVRRTAYQNYADAYLAFQNTIAGMQTMSLQRDVFNARARHFETALEASMTPNNIPTVVYHNLLEVFKANLPTWHRYWAIRRRALKLDELHVYDIKAPLTQQKIEVTYQQAVDWIVNAMQPLGEEYIRILRDGCTVDRWVDRALNKGKRQGAFSWGAYDTQPFIMLSYSDDVFSMSTLAHELGHSMHSFYSRRTQPFVYGRYTLFAAEVASNFNQALVRDYLFKTQDDPAFQMALIEEAMANYHRYFFIMPTLARWELEMHTRVEQGAPLNAEIMTQRCAELFSEGYGDEVVYDMDRIGITWAQFQHMYMNYYVYSYATGISGANALANRVLSGVPNAAEDYLKFLKAGGSMYPLDALKMAGVDLTTPEPVEKAFGVLSDIVDRLDKLVG
jgi:oligoendopeptidase F